MSVHDPSLQASPWPRVTFFDLSRELRDSCYSSVLTSSTPIIAWSSIRRENSELIKGKEFEKDLETASQFKNATSDERNTALNLLRCNSVIAHEVASIFYGKNKFIFAGDWTWETVAIWFENIGLRNRTFVTSIEVWQHQTSHAWQTPSGERVKVLELLLETDWVPLESPFPRNRHLYRSPDSTSQGLVETIDPAIETFFELLGNERPSKLLLTIFLRESFIPGLGHFLGAKTGPYSWFSMDLPNVVEKLRTIYTADGVDVVWKGEHFGEHFLKIRENLEACWKIVQMEEFDLIARSAGGTRTDRWMQFTLRSKKLPEPLLAEEPAPWSGFGYYSIDDDRTLIYF